MDVLLTRRSFTHSPTRLHAMNASQTTRSTMPSTTYPQGWRPSLACPPGVCRRIRVNLTSNVAADFGLSLTVFEAQLANILHNAEEAR